MLLLIIWRIAPRLPQPRASLETYLVKSVLRFGIGDGYGHTLADWRYQHSGGLATSRHARAGGSQTCSLFCGTLPARAWHDARNERRASCTKK